MPEYGGPGVCGSCNGTVESEWTSSDETFLWFYRRLTEAMFPGTIARFPSPPPDWFKSFMAACSRRERIGRPTFGYAYLGRDNPTEGQEEAADGANYAFFDMLVAIRESGDPDEIDTALTAAQHFARAYEALAKLRRKHHSAPG